MKRAPIAQRLAFILFFVALTSIAFGNPPEQAQGEPPPFNVENCEFDQGRTVCMEETVGDKQLFTSGAGGVDWDAEGCEPNEVMVVIEGHYEWPIWVTTTVYRGSSHVVESTHQQLLDLVEGEVVIVDSWCMVL